MQAVGECTNERERLIGFKRSESLLGEQHRVQQTFQFTGIQSLITTRYRTR